MAIEKTPLQIKDEELLDLLNGAKPGSISQVIKVYPDETKLDKKKSRGSEIRTLLANIVTRTRAWVREVVLVAPADWNFFARAKAGATMSTKEGFDTLAAYAKALDTRMRTIESAMKITVLLKPTNFTAVTAGTRITLSWDNPNALGLSTGFEISKSTDGADYTVVVASTLQEAYEETGLAPGTYYYMVRCLGDASNNILKSEPAYAYATVTSTVVVPPPPPPAPPALAATVEAVAATVYGGDDGKIRITSITGGVQPYLYQTSQALAFVALPNPAVFPVEISGFSFGGETITIKDSAATPATITQTVQIGEPAEVIPPVTGYFGLIDDTGVYPPVLPTEAAMLASPSFTFADGANLSVDFKFNTQPKHMWVMEPAAQPAKTKWFYSAGNSGDIGTPGSYINAPTVRGAWRIYVTAYGSQNKDFNLQLLK